MTNAMRLAYTMTALAAGIGMASAQPAPAPQPPAAQAPAVGHPRPGMPPAGHGPMMGGGAARPMGMMGQGGMASFRHIEGQIAYWKAELRITDAQAPQWTAFADALRNSAKNQLTAMHAAAKGGSGGAPDFLEQRIAMLAAEQDAVKAVLTATKPLYAVLSDEQKQVADELMAERMMGMGMS